MKEELVMRLKSLVITPAVVLVLVVSPMAIHAAQPPDPVNYQGVLRGTDDAPLDGDFDMVFRFFSAGTGGDEILIDRHTTADSAPVTVSGGLFNVRLGGGAVQDGSGPLVYDTLGDVFADHSEVWLEIEVDGESLAPRIRFTSSPYASNAAHLGGRTPADFLDTSSHEQAKLGKLVVGAASGTSSAFAVEGYGTEGGGYFEDTDSSGYAYVANGHYGVRGYGSIAGGRFADSDGSGYAFVGYGDHGIRGFGSVSGGYFKDSDHSGYAYAGYGNRGISAAGNEMGGYFEDADSSGYAYAGYGDTGVVGYGMFQGGHFADSDDSGYATVGDGDRGINAKGNEAGGFFLDTDDTGYAYLGYDTTGIEAYGNEMGGYFEDASDGSHAFVAYGDRGIEAHAETMAGYFQNWGWGSYTRLAYGGYGIQAYGTGMAGHFSDSTGSGEAEVAEGDYGIQAFGNNAGGYFEDTNDGSQAWLAYGNYGVEGFGNSAGGYFSDSNSSGLAYVGYGDRGIWGKGTFAGGTFSHPDGVTYWADVAQFRDATTYKIRGTGTVSFVQNHPYEKDKVIVYAAPEGDEVAVYTRGTARLENGEARVTLGETFALVANPDIGLTAHVTPRDEADPLSVTEVSTAEIVVRGPAGSNVAFDYLVHGLRIGFEEHSPVQTKDREAFLPPREAAAEFYEEHPELRRFNALERFKTMRVATGASGELDLSKTETLIAQIDENREEIVAAARLRVEEERAAGRAHRQQVRDEDSAGVATGAGGVDEESVRTATDKVAEDRDLGTHVPGNTSRLEGVTWLPVSETVEQGDVLALDPDRPGTLRRASSMADSGLIGIASGPSTVSARGEHEAPVASSGIVEVRADAGYGEIRPGDLVVASPTPGHAMRAIEVSPRTVVGKAIDPLVVGTGTIRVLILLR
jgi:hypothetical protein